MFSSFWRSWSGDGLCGAMERVVLGCDGGYCLEFWCVRFVVAVVGLLDSSGIFGCVVESVVELLRFSYDAEIVW